jgi:hypothetical protein
VKADYKTNPTGPLSPAQLAQLDRVLTPDEQAAVNAYQAAADTGQAEAAYTASQQRRGVSTPIVTRDVKATFEPSATPSRALMVPTAPTPTVAKAAVPWWYWLLAIGGGVLVLGGSAYAVRRAIS